MIENPAYGTLRLALSIGVNKKRISRIRRKYGLKTTRLRSKRFRKLADEKQKSTEYENLTKNSMPIRPGLVYAGDFTFISHKGSYVFLATFMDVRTRQIVGWDISTRHTAKLVKSALRDAIERTNQIPEIVHTDQGSEYRSIDFTGFAKAFGIKVSMSSKSSPWQNAYQESFYGSFKVDLGDSNRFETLGQLIAAIHQTINYYNKTRIHTSLKMSPDQYYQLLKLA